MKPGKWYLTRVLPYRSAEDRIAGVVITLVDITRRKQAEEGLRESKLYAERIIDTLHEPLIVLTPELQVRSANLAFYAHFEVHPEETEGRLIYELGNSQWDIPALRVLLEEILLENNVFNDFEVEHDFEQIGQRVMLLNGRRLDDVPLILLSIRDITERKRGEAALRRSEERLQRMINIESVGVLTRDESGALIGANDTFLGMHGYSREEVEAGTMTWRDLTPAEYIEMSERQMQKLEETGRIKPYEKEYLRKDGSRSWMLFAGASLSDGTTVEYCIDVGDRKRAEEALGASEERYRTLFESIDEGFCIVEVLFDDDGQPVDYRFLETNPAFEKQTGLHEAVGQRMRAFAPHHEEYWFETYGRIAMTGEPERFTNEAKYLDERWFDVYAFRVGQPEERKVAILFSDISERKQAEEALQWSEAQLAAEVAAMSHLHEWVVRLLASADLQTALAEVLKATIVITGAELGNIQLFNPASRALEIVVQRGFDQDFLDYFRTVTIDGDSACARAMASGRRVVIEDVQTEPGYEPHRQMAASAGYRAVQSTPLTSRDGKLLGMLSTHYPTPHRPSERDLCLLDLYARQAADFIEHVRREEALRTSEQRFRAIFETAGVSVWVEDFSEVKQALDELRAQGVEDLRTYLADQPEFVRRAIDLVGIVDVNPETVELFGATAKAELLSSLANVFVPETDALFIEELVALAEGRESLEAETPLQTLDGHRLTVLFTIHFGPPDWNYSHVVVTLTDITARKQTEEALQRLNERLEQRVAERTLALAEQNQRLRQLTLQLTHAEQQERRRIARTLHDGLQQLLVAAKVHLPMALTDQGPEIVERLETILDQAHEAARSLSYELSPPTLYKSDLPEALQWLAEWFSTHHRFEVDLVIDAAFPALPEQLKVFLYEAIRELLLNAVKHSGEEMATVCTRRTPNRSPSPFQMRDEASIRSTWSSRMKICTGLACSASASG